MLLGFKKRFVDPIQIGTKVFTMRVKPKRTPTIGEKLYMYTGLRTSNCQKICEETLISIQHVRIMIEMEATVDVLQLNIWVDNRSLRWEEVLEFVMYDGFEDVAGFLDWWTQGGKQKRVGGFLELYHWTDLRY